MAKANHVDAAVSSMTRQGRKAVGNDTYNQKLDARKPSKNTKLVAKKDSKSGALLGPGGNRKNELYPGPAGRGDRDGAAFRITAQEVVPQSPQASQNLRNTRLVKSAVNRSTPSFGDGSRSGY